MDKIYHQWTNNRTAFDIVRHLMDDFENTYMFTNPNGITIVIRIYIVASYKRQMIFCLPSNVTNMHLVVYHRYIHVNFSR